MCKPAADAAKFVGSKGLCCLGRALGGGGGSRGSSRLGQGIKYRGTKMLRVRAVQLRLGLARALPLTVAYYSQGELEILLSQWRQRQHALLLADAAACLPRHRPLVTWRVIAPAV